MSPHIHRNRHCWLIDQSYSDETFSLQLWNNHFEWFTLMMTLYNRRYVDGSGTESNLASCNIERTSWANVEHVRETWRDLLLTSSWVTRRLTFNLDLDISLNTLWNQTWNSEGYETWGNVVRCLKAEHCCRSESTEETCFSVQLIIQKSCLMHSRCFSRGALLSLCLLIAKLYWFSLQNICPIIMVSSNLWWGLFPRWDGANPAAITTQPHSRSPKKVHTSRWEVNKEHRTRIQITTIVTSCRPIMAH